MSHQPDCDLPLVGVAELADSLGIRRQYVSRWVAAGDLPPPDHQLAMGPAWFLTDHLQSIINRQKETSP